MAAKVIAILYDSTKALSVVSMQIARLKFSHNSGVANTITTYDTAGLDEAHLLTLCGTTLVEGTYDDIVVACPTQATYSATGMPTYDQVALLDLALKTASKGTVVRANTCQTNSTKTYIKLDTGASASNDFYNGKYIKTAGVTAVYRYITDYVGASTHCVVTDTGTAITDTETFIVYTNAHVWLWGDASSNIAAPMVAWAAAFPNTDPPLIVKMLGGYGTIAAGTFPPYGGTAFAPYAKYDKTATGVGTATLSDTGEFTAGAYNDGGWYVAIESATLGDGEVHRIVSNTADTLTLAEDWTVQPTGTRKYQVVYGNRLPLMSSYLPYAITTYLEADNAKNNSTWKELLDKYDMIRLKSATNVITNDALLDTYAQRGKCIFDAKCKGVVT